MKYINAEQLIDILAMYKDESLKKSSVYSWLILMPSADVRENIHGEWVKSNPLTDTFECSLCGMQISVPEMCSP